MVNDTASVSSETGSGVRLADGRLLTFREAGPSDGMPVVYCHGALGAPRWRSGELDCVLRQYGIRYILANRPGYAGSDPSPGRRVVDFARDVGDLMDTLGYERFALIGVSSGAPYALACGSVMPQRVTALAAVSPLGPAAGAGASAGLRYRAILLPFGPGPRRTRLTRMSLRLFGLLRDTHPSAMIEDYLVCRAEWGFDPSTISVPITVWHGRRDRVVPISHGRRLAHVIPGCAGCRTSSGGHFFYSRAVDAIIGALVRDPVTAG